MSRIAYVNGEYVRHSNACVHVEDRGYQFADGVYEVVAVRRGRLIDLDGHMERLWRSLGELTMAAPMKAEVMTIVLREVVRRNRLADGIVYIQINRGVAPRDHAFPGDAVPSIVITAKRLSFEAVAQKAEKGIRAVSVPDIRWGRCDIKSIALLPNILAKQTAKEAGAAEAIMFDADGMVTEGSSTNVWLVIDHDTLVTRPTDDNILAGITRGSIMDIARSAGLNVEERAFSLAEAYTAKELFVTSTTSCATPVIELDGKPIGSGSPGPVALQLVRAYLDGMDSQTMQ